MSGIDISFNSFYSNLCLYICSHSGPGEVDMNSMHRVLRPIVDELKELYLGVRMQFPPSAGSILPTFHWIHAVLILVCADAPMLRKLLGFAGHTGRNFCSKCECTPEQIRMGFLEDDEEQKEFSQIPLRTKEKHREHGKQWRSCRTKERRTECVSLFGYLYTPFHDLVYCDSIRYAVIDPMHALLLGLAKHLLQILTDMNILKKSVFAAMQKRMARLRAPSELGRIPRKIDSQLSKLKADQVKKFLASSTVTIILLPTFSFLACYFVSVAKFFSSVSAFYHALCPG